MGTFQECSKDLHALLEILADCKHESNGFSQGDGGDSEREEHLPLRAKERAEYCLGQGTVFISPWQGCMVCEGHRAAAKRRRVREGRML